MVRRGTRRRRTSKPSHSLRPLESGVLLSRDGDGHTAYGAGNTCIDDAVNTYLVKGNAASRRHGC
ncbi:MAG: alpha/beta hydrolase [Nocardioidaceae bacterium]